MHKCVIDTNYILRYFLADNKSQYKQTKQVMDKVRGGELTAYLEQAVFVEVMFVLSSFYEVPKEKIIEAMHGLLMYKGIETDKTLLNKALEVYSANNIHIVDAIIVARCQELCVEPLSFDKKLVQVAKQ